MKPKTRDFVNLFFIMKTYNFSLNYLINLTKAKFDWHIEPIQLRHKFTMVLKKQDFPKMLVLFNKKEMKDHFLKLAKSLEKEIFQ